MNEYAANVFTKIGRRVIYLIKSAYQCPEDLTIRC